MKKSVRKSLLNSVILALFLAVLAGYYFAVIVPGSKKKNETTGPLLEKFRKNDVRSLDVVCSGPTNRYRVTLENRDGSWSMTAPYREDADSETVNTTVNALSALEIVRTFTNTGGSNDYGIGKPELTVSIGYSDGTSLAVLDGGRSSDGVYHYFSVSDRSNFVYLVRTEQQKDLLSVPEDYRDKNIFHIPMNDLTSAEVVSGSKTYRIAFTGGEHREYALTSPVRKTLDGAAVRSKLVDLYSLTVSRFIGNGKQANGLSAYGLDNPKFTARLYSGGKMNELMIGNSSGTDTYYILIPQRNVLGEIADPELAQKFDMTAWTGVPGEKR